VLHRITCAQQAIDHWRSWNDLAFAHFIEQGFKDMREVGNVGKIERACAPFNRVRAAENRIQRFAIGRCVKPQQFFFHIREQLKTFADIGLLKLGKRIVHPATF